MRKLILTVLLGVTPASAEETSLTIYSSANPSSFDPQQFIEQQRQGYQSQSAKGVPGFGVVKVERDLALKTGINELRFTDVAQFIDPTTVTFTDLSPEKGANVLEQNFEFDLASPEKVLDKYIGKTVELTSALGDKSETMTGTLLSNAQGLLLLKTESGLRLLNRTQTQVKMGELPGGLVLQPTLVWKLNAKAEGTRKVRTTYQTNGLTWRADYNVVVNKEDSLASIDAWVTILNLSGAAFQNSKLKLIAGDVQRVQPDARVQRAFAKAVPADSFAQEAFEEKSFFEYHLYTLPRKTTVLSNMTQQLSLFPQAKDVAVEKILVYYGAPNAPLSFGGDPYSDRDLDTDSNTKLDVYLRIVNEQKNRMGMPLPAGKVRVYKEDNADGTLEFIGEDLIDHTPKDEKLLVKLGQSFDVVGERTQVDFSANLHGHQIIEKFKIEVKNHKEVSQKVLIKENLFRWSTWAIAEKSDDFERVDARTIHFPVTVPANGSKVVTYTVKYTW